MSRGWIEKALLVIGFAAAMGAGYFVSDRLGSEAVRQEAQVQLARLLQGEVRIGRARVVIRGGLYLEGDRVGVYPEATIPHRPALFASHVAAELDVFAMLTGRFALSQLILDDVTFHIDRDPSGQWSPRPVAKLDSRRRRAMPDDMERNLNLINAFETVSRVLLEFPLIARRVELRGGRVLLRDARAVKPGDPPLELELTDLFGELRHVWLTGEAKLALGGKLHDRMGARVPLWAEGHRGRDEVIRLAIRAERLPLSTLAGYLGPSPGDVEMDGRVSGELAFETPSRRHGVLRLHWQIEDFAARIAVREGLVRLERPLLQLDASLELHPGRLRFADAMLTSDDVVTRVVGSIERPLRLSSRTHLECNVRGLSLEAVRTSARNLPGREAATIAELLAAIESGRIDRIGASGTATMATWRALLLGEQSQLPDGFALSATLSDIALQAGPQSQIKRLGARVGWSGDRISLRNARALWNEAPLPTLDLTLDGVSHLFSGPPASREVAAGAEPLPGLGALWDLLHTDGDADDGDIAPIKLMIERLDHPALRWPVRDARIRIEPGASGAAIAIEAGRWAGAPLSGSASWVPAPARRLAVELSIAPPAGEVSRIEDAGRGEPPPEAEPPYGDGEWGAGRFETASLDTALLPLRRVHGRFSLSGATLALSQVRADVEPSGSLVARGTLGLGVTQSVDSDFKLSLVAGDVDAIGRSLGLPEGLASGKVQIAGGFTGTLRPQTPLLEGLTGQIEIDARDGVIHRKVPLVVEIAQATSGFNRFANSDELNYESVKASLRFDHGTLSTENFELEGPLRVYASGTLDLIADPYPLKGVVGIFLFRRAGQFLDSLPLIKALLPGSEKGLVGAYFALGGSLDEPEVEAMPGKSLAEDLPEVLTAPFKAMKAILDVVSSSGPDQPAPSAAPERQLGGGATESEATSAASVPPAS